MISTETIPEIGFDRAIFRKNSCLGAKSVLSCATIAS